MDTSAEEQRLSRLSLRFFIEAFQQAGVGIRLTLRDRSMRERLKSRMVERVVQ